MTEKKYANRNFIEKFLTESKDISRDSYLWNIICSILIAFQSVVLLMVLTRTIGLEQAGIFTIANANANLFLNIGKYGMIYYQISDVKNRFTFREYVYSRVFTTFIMLVVSALYVIYTAIIHNYSIEKTWIILFMCLYKTVDAIEDVFSGRYQQMGRLDVAAKVLAFRTGLSLIVYIIGLIFIRNQLYTLIITTILSFLWMACLLFWTYEPFQEKDKSCHPKQVLRILKTCFPLFIGFFMSFYIGNAPKYAIDAQLSDELQACYGFISMPVFVIGLLNSFIFNPILHKMSMYWERKDIRAFCRRILVQSGMIVLITVVCVAGAWLIGIPILSWMYHTNLSSYKTELLILLVGGGFLGLSGFLNAMITIIRFQKSVAWGYGIIALAAFSLSSPIVRSYGIMGAAVLYTALMCGLSLCFIILLIWGIKRQK